MEVNDKSVKVITKKYKVLDGKGWEMWVELEQIDWTPFPEGKAKDQFERLDRLMALTDEVIEAYFEYNERRLSNFELYVLQGNVGEYFVVDVKGTPSFQARYPEVAGRSK